MSFSILWIKLFDFFFWRGGVFIFKVCLLEIKYRCIFKSSFCSVFSQNTIFTSLTLLIILWNNFYDLMLCFLFIWSFYFSSLLFNWSVFSFFLSYFHSIFLTSTLEIIISMFSYSHLFNIGLLFFIASQIFYVGSFSFFLKFIQPLKLSLKWIEILKLSVVVHLKMSTFFTSWEMPSQDEN